MTFSTINNGYPRFTLGRFAVNIFKCRKKIFSSWRALMNSTIQTRLLQIEELVVTKKVISNAIALIALKALSECACITESVSESVRAAYGHMLATVYHMTCSCACRETRAVTSMLRVMCQTTDYMITRSLMTWLWANKYVVWCTAASIEYGEALWESNAIAFPGSAARTGGVFSLGVIAPLSSEEGW